MSKIGKPIPGRVWSAAEGGIVTGADSILDDRLNRDQEDINKDTYRKSETYRKYAGQDLNEETYSAAQLNSMITTPNQKYVTVAATDQTSDIATLIATEAPDKKEQSDTIYRIANWDGTVSQYDQYVYSEYAWDGNQYIFLSVKDLGHQLLAIEFLANGDIEGIYGEEIADNIYVDALGDIIIEQEINIV